MKHEHGVILQTFRAAEEIAADLGGVVILLIGAEFKIERYGVELLKTPSVFEARAFLLGFTVRANID